MKDKFVVANWKMNMNLKDLSLWFANFSKLIIPNHPTQIIVAPSFPYLSVAKELAKDSTISISAQDVSIYTKGAHTGYIGGFQLVDYCTYCLVGHSERKETIADVIKKRDLCLQNGIIPIVCFSDTSSTILQQLYVDDVLLAWEDPSNISKDGQYRAKDTDLILQTVALIRQALPTSAYLLYGGSVNRQNIRDLVNINGLDGVLAGNSGLDPVHFANLIEAYAIQKP